MDEARVRDLLHQVAETETMAPRSAVDVGAARAVGGRRRRTRRVYLPWGAPLAAAVAVALIAGIPSLFGSDHVGRVEDPPLLAGTSSPTKVPTRFNPLRPYAQFGWLPAGTKSGQGEQLSQWEDLFGGPLSQPIEVHLLVTPRGQCKLSRAATGQSSISCDRSPMGAVTRAPAVHGRRAYWAKQGGLWWNYGTGAWADLSVLRTAHDSLQVSREQMLRIAAGVRYGFSYPIESGFVYRGPMPPGWSANSQPSDFMIIDGRPVAADAGLGSPEDSVFLEAWPAGAGLYNRCVAGGAGGVFQQDPAKIPQRVTGHGTTALVWTLNGESYWHQVLCAQNADGLFVTIDLTFHQDSQSRRTGDAVGGALEVFLHLRLLGPNMSTWTTTPVPAIPRG
jgi:hypothetical protein